MKTVVELLSRPLGQSEIFLLYSNSSLILIIIVLIYNLLRCSALHILDQVVISLIILHVLHLDTKRHNCLQQQCSPRLVRVVCSALMEQLPVEQDAGTFLDPRLDQVGLDGLK